MEKIDQFKKEVETLISGLLSDIHGRVNKWSELFEMQFGTKTGGGALKTKTEKIFKIEIDTDLGELNVDIVYGHNLAENVCIEIHKAVDSSKNLVKFKDKILERLHSSEFLSFKDKFRNL